ncbi:hypothetical protein ACE1YR_08045 [Pseudomonas sp. K1(2024)]|uniref:Halovibrin HvnA n=1 Tax=Pseudomonas boreofloridensis TaxID=3064348 RepID=A0ABV4Z6Y0_9PSED|nr:hypothetical protein [Pseudomonas sp. K13]MDO7902242.1 hypothetical protein [Pseudomonas sp. K13]
MTIVTLGRSLLLSLCLAFHPVYALQPLADPDTTASSSMAAQALLAQAAADQGLDVAQGLNARLASTPIRCVRNQPDYACSGVLVKPVLDSRAAIFWEHDIEARARGTEQLEYLRADLAPRGGQGQVGYVLMSHLDARAQGKDYQVRQRPNAAQVYVANWDETQPAQVAIEALYYPAGRSDALLLAQRAQQAWFSRTRQWLPVLRLDSTRATSAFGFDQQDQLYSGYTLADQLNGRYRDTATRCRNNTPAYYCNGVLIRATGAADSFRAWNPSPNSVGRNGVSFSYVRADVGTVRLANNQAGLIFKPADYPVTQPATLRCAYPANAGTSSTPNSCRASCLSQGITTVAQWRARYGNTGAGNCAFSMEPRPDAAQFQLNVDVRSNGGAHNEMIIAAWPPNIPEKLPIEAIYYPVNGREDQASLIQRQYFSATRRFMPVIRVNLTAGAGAIFIFRPEDQNR